MPEPELNRIAFVGSYVPRRCGIATFTRDLRQAVAAHLPDCDCLVVPVSDAGTAHDYPAEAAFECAESDPAAYARVADFLDLANVDVVSLQHEYGIFGGEAGSHVLTLLRDVRAPVHTTLHTVLARPTPAQRRVMDDVIHLSARLAVMTEGGRALLREVHGVPPDRVDVIPHGIPDMEFADPEPHKPALGLAGADVILTFGLLSPGKGIEDVIAALPRIVARHPRAVYVVLGATHPHLLRTQGEAYRAGLARLAGDLGVGAHVVFHDRFVEMRELRGFLAAADVYVTPYLGEDQITSGTLAYAFGCGRAVVSTPYRHARELLADGRGMLVPFRDPAAIAAAVNALLDDDTGRETLRRQAWEVGREMLWDRVAARYADAFRRTRQATAVKPRRAAAADAPRPPRLDLPPIVLDHLWRLTDDTGVVQHATFDVPDRAAGYCTDDVARALALVVRLEALGIDPPRTARAAATCAAFLGHAFDPATGRFRNFLAYDRRWLDDGGSADCQGRALVALGTCIGRSRRPGLRRWAAQFFGPALAALAATDSPRAWALGIVAIHEYMRRLPGDRRAAAIRRDLVARLLGLRARCAGPGWPWFEDVVAYENARPCQALVLAGRWAGDRAALDAGLEMLGWLCDLQRSPHGRFAPVGCRGFLPRGGTPAAFDQQPIEAEATVAACLEAFHATGDAAWLDRAWSAFDWFLGHNVLGLAVCDPGTGGCRDGLLEDRVNENRGAESTIAWLSALVEMRLLARALGPAEAAAAESGDGRRAARAPGTP
ncbi:MAG: glycosyltransferase [Planctomycetaceae bacterium]